MTGDYMYKLMCWIHNLDTKADDRPGLNGYTVLYRK
jgi:hypothetical protein